MLIRTIEEKDIPQIASIHFRYLKVGILSALGESFLGIFYKSFMGNSNTFTLVVVDDSKIVGFASGATNLKTILKATILSLWFPVMITVIKKPNIFAKLAQTPFYPSFKSGQNFGEIFSLAVVPSARGKGIGTKLIKACQIEFKKRGYNHFRLSVREKMQEANIFYQKLKLKKKGSARFLNEKIIFYGN
ncbi:MAG: GNAT family N-acetyltransferase [Candidatus Curtissbacteria bacterium]|nr:GNAT family N-acetyltransferase [Candidatus Curtissbacteria bacterium]